MRYLQQAKQLGDRLVVTSLNPTVTVESIDGAEVRLTDIPSMTFSNIQYEPLSCCLVRGDVDHSGGIPNVSDLTYIVAYLFQSGPPPPCEPEADVNGSGGLLNVADLTYLVAYLFQGGPPPASCP